MSRAQAYRKRRTLPSNAAKLLLLCATIFGVAPRVPAQVGLSAGVAANAGTITVYVTSESGQPFETKFIMSLTPTDFGNPVPTFPRETASGWVFEGLVGDTYHLSVEAKGFQPVHEAIDLPTFSGAQESVIVVMKPLDESITFQRPSGEFVLAPRVAKEVQKGVSDLQMNNFSSARKHLSKALSAAPGNPYVNYVMGMSYLLDKKLTQAQPYLEKSVSLDPRQVAPLTALGNLRFQTGNYAGAIRVLDAAVQADPNSWKSQWVLADCYLHEGDSRQALEHARQAMKSGGERAEQVELLVAEALAGLGDRPGAAAALNQFVAKNPLYPNLAKIREWQAELAQPVPSPQVVPVASSQPAGVAVGRAITTTVSSTPVVPVLVPPAEPPPNADWAPPDIDSEKPFLISGASCALPKVLDSASARAEQLVKDLQNFTATEDYETVEVKRGGWIETPQRHAFSYMVIIDRPERNSIQVQELRSPALTPKDLPGGIADMGAPSLAFVFHPVYRKDYDWSCEGLGQWNRKPAWVVRFSQATDRKTSLLSALDTGSARFAIPLKGRAWIGVNNGEVMHLETDLVKPIEAAGLTKQHFVVDYAPVAFRTHKVEVWLPKNVDLYLQYKHHYLHYRHQYSNFKLFWVGTSEKDEQPKETKKGN